MTLLQQSPLKPIAKGTVPALALGLLLVLVGVLLQQDGTLAADPLAHLILVLTGSVLMLHRIRKQPLPRAPEVGGIWLAVVLAAAAALSAFTSPIGADCVRSW